MKKVTDGRYRCRAYELERGQTFQWRPTIASPWQTFVVTQEFVDDNNRMRARPINSGTDDTFNEEADVEIDHVTVKKV